MHVSMIHTMTGSKIQNMHGHMIEKKRKAKYKQFEYFLYIYLCIHNMILSIMTIWWLSEIIDIIRKS